MKILIVNDEVMILRMIETILISSCEINRDSIEKAYNGMECYNLVAEQHFDLIILDLNMPVLGGCAACQLIRKLYKDKSKDFTDNDGQYQMVKAVEPFIVALSAAGNFHEFKTECQRAGFDDQYTVPITAT